MFDGDDVISKTLNANYGIETTHLLKILAVVDSPSVEDGITPADYMQREGSKEINTVTIPAVRN
jgi:hypothetical protein